MKSHVKVMMAAAVAAGAVWFAAAEESEEVVVAQGRMEFWMGAEEADAASAASGFWMGPDEIEVDNDIKLLTFMPPWSWPVGAEAYAYTNEVGVLIVFGEGAATSLPAGVDRTAIKGAVIEDDVTSIGSRFFKKCYRLNTFTAGADLVSIGEKAFYLCASLENIELKNDAALTSLANAVVYRTAIREDGTLYTIPAISLPNYKAVLYGTNDLTDPAGWKPVDSGRTMEETGYHFFKYVLEKDAAARAGRTE